MECYCLGGSRNEATGGDGGEDGGDDSAEGGSRAAEHRGRTTADDAEDRGRKSVEDGPNVPIHAEFCIEYGSTFAATATDAIPPPQPLTTTHVSHLTPYTAD